MADRHRKGKRLSQVDPSSIEDGTQGFNSWSQPLQNSDNDRGIPYANTWMNNVQDPNETTSTYSAWDGERTQQPLYQYVSGEQDATDMRAFDPQQNGFQPVMQQAMHPHYAERILDNELLPDARTQHRVGTSNTVEAQRHWSSTYDMESSVESTRNDTSRLDPWPQSPHAIENPLQGHEHDPNSALSSGFTTAQQSTQNADYSYELSGISPMIGTQDPGYVGNGSVELPFMGVDGTQTGANPDPWSPYQPPELSHLAQQSGTNHETYLGSFSGATSSTFGSDNLELGRQVVDGTQSYLSSHHVHNDGTNSGMLTRHPRHLHLHIPQEMVPAPSSLDPLFNCPTFFVRTATPPVVVSDTE
ncbi:hypothetical protein AA0114_g11609 [Alternaria tenuissima]|uniref:Uncharacterized protein n=1 Tax=Alternaria tenuissima TaxID=119927 RepID=A0A4Q4M3D8_9PLEO|nr:hypothetical protein AA0114_g11609 [Alternaria tenuissima]